ncbi:MAG: 1-deoxy-D-xylulose-5-phosphate reductoisomerase [Desulfobacterales bacterium]|nr:1-deoxy-D-xylulose-5-phosphate reductoisomerase [Desulfobacterales bacterium]
MKKITILGSTGSIGKTALKIVEMFPERYWVKALCAGKNIELLASQIKKFKPEIAVVYDENSAMNLKKLLKNTVNVEILFGETGYVAAAAYDSVELVLSAIVGSPGLMPTVSAIKANKDVALANKESLVMAGEYIMQLSKKNNTNIFPVDSEHSAIFQCLSGQRRQDLIGIILTASGGPFHNKSYEDFASITIKDALNHPTWNMGKKITIDSATLMNKGLEVIEASWLFGIDADLIEVLIHEQSIIHSMVKYRDGSVIAQLGIPDMTGAISFAMSYPERLPINKQPPNFAELKALTFKKPDYKKFPCLYMAYQACKAGGTMPAVLNSANEVAVEAFLNEKISFTAIPELIQKVIDKHQIIYKPELQEIIDAHLWAQKQAIQEIMN